MALKLNDLDIQLNSTQQRITNAGVWYLLVRIIIIYYHKLKILLYNYFWLVFGTSQIGRKIKLHWLVKMYLQVMFINE